MPTALTTVENTDSLEYLPDADLLRAYWVYSFVSQPWLVAMGSKIGGWSVEHLWPARWAVSKTIFAQFCGGESVEKCAATMQHLAASHIHTILDYSVEGAATEAVFTATEQEIAGTIRAAAVSPSVAFSVFKVSGLGRSEVLTELSASGNYTKLSAEAKRIVERVNNLCHLAHQLGVRIFIDAEHTYEQPFIDYLALQAMQAYNTDRPIVFNTYQLYLKDGLERLKSHAEMVWKTGGHFGAKLVRGAYMEREADLAIADNRQSPINPSKIATDTLYDAAASFCLAHIDKTAFCLGTHNAASCKKVAETMQKMGLPASDARVWFAQLLGMSDNLSYPFAAKNYNVAKYVPYGPVEAVVPYLIRRAQENTSVAGESSREYRLIATELKRRKLNAWRFFL